MAELTRCDTKNNQAHEAKGKAQAYAQGVEQPPPGLVALVDKKEVSTAREAYNERQHENNDQNFEHNATCITCGLAV